MEPFTIDIILPIASGALFTTQAVYYLGLYNKLYTHSRVHMMERYFPFPCPIPVLALYGMLIC